MSVVTLTFSIIHLFSKDFYRVAGLRGVYLASQVAPGVFESQLRPSDLTTLISFDGGTEWQQAAGPRQDNWGHPILGCYQVLDVNCQCS